MDEKPKMFVALSYDIGDEKVNEFIMGILKCDFSVIPADFLSAEPPQEKVPNLIKEAEIFAAILTKRHKIQGKDEWKPSDWIQQEIGMAHMVNKHCLIFQEERVELSGIPKAITTMGEFDRNALEKSVQKFVDGVRKEAKKLKEERIVKIEGWHDTKREVEDIIEGAEKYIYGIVEDFTSINRFESSLSQLNKDVDFLLICSPFGDDIAKLERTINDLKCKSKEIRFIHPSKIGRIRIMFNERFGLFVIHARGDEYFGIRITPVDDLKNHFNLLKEESCLEKDPVRLEGKFYKIEANDLANSLIWAIKGISEFGKGERFLYILASKFTLFVRNQELKKSIIDLASQDGCKIDIILSKKAADRGSHEKSLYEILSETIGKHKCVGIHMLDENYPIGQRRIIITNKLAMNILDFGGQDYYYSVVQDQNHINIMKGEIEQVYLNRKECFIDANCIQK
jgi:hypothetical protein